MLQHMDKDLFEIFPDLPLRRIVPPVRQGVRSVEHPPPPTTHIARGRFAGVDRETKAAFRRIREIAQAEYERLAPKGRPGRMLRIIITLADSAILTPTNRRG